MAETPFVVRTVCLMAGAVFIIVIFVFAPSTHLESKAERRPSAQIESQMRSLVARLRVRA